MRSIIISFILVFILKSSAFAVVFEEETPPVKQKLLWRNARHEISPIFGWTFQEPYVRTLLTMLNYNYYLTNWLGVGAEFGYGSPFDTALKKNIEKELSTQEKSFLLSTSNPHILALFNVSYVPIYGKFILAKKLLLNYDIHLIVGIGYGLINGVGHIEDSSSLASSFGIGARFFITKWSSLIFQFKNYIMKSSLNSKKDGLAVGKKFHSHLTVSFGFSFFFPSEVKIGK